MNDEAVGSCESRKSPQLLAFYNLIVISRFFSSFSTQFVFFFSVFFLFLSQFPTILFLLLVFTTFFNCLLSAIVFQFPNQRYLFAGWSVLYWESDLAIVEIGHPIGERREALFFYLSCMECEVLKEELVSPQSALFLFSNEKRSAETNGN